MTATRRHVRAAMTIGAAMALALSMVACSSDSDASAGSGDGTTATPAKIRVMVYDGAYTSMPVHIAASRGFYEKNGLDADIVTVNSGPAGVAAAVGGSIDFVEPPTDQVITAQSKGVDLRLVVGNEVKNFYKVVVRKGVPLPHESEGYQGVMRDLKGKVIGVNVLGGTSQATFNVLLRESGMKETDVKFVAVGAAATALPAWEAGRLDAVVQFTPFVEIVDASDSGKVAIDLTETGPQVLQGIGGAFEGFSAMGSFIEKNPDTVNAFIKAHEQAIAWMKDPANHEALVQEVKQKVSLKVIPANLQDVTVDRMIKNYANYLGTTIDRAGIDAWNSYMVSGKMIDAAVPVDRVVYPGAPKPS